MSTFHYFSYNTVAMYNLYEIHGILQFIAFVILFPLGILVAVFRNWIGSMWFVIHVGLHSAAILTLIAALLCVGLASYNKNKNKEKDKKETRDTPLHVILGYIVVGLVFFQIVWAVGLREVVPFPTWLLVHGILAISILVTGWINLYLGYMLLVPS